MSHRTSAAQAYLQPYREAARHHGGEFESLLWASRRSQGKRFDAMQRIYDVTGHRLLDAGAGRADLLEYLLNHQHRPAHYYAVEAVDALADEIGRRAFSDCTLIRADFVQQPDCLSVGADVVVFSGSLNTLEPRLFYTTLQHAWAATSRSLVFNFLASPLLAASPHLYWHSPQEVAQFARTLSAHYELLDDYLDGDCTMRIDKPHFIRLP
ncbi:MAG: hypothetical protein IT448_07460 [Phycisphaerales bacterium]|nr:hypothetical protein [Phycisphaerales bacterium]